MVVVVVVVVLENVMEVEKQMELQVELQVELLMEKVLYFELDRTQNALWSIVCDIFQSDLSLY